MLMVIYTIFRTGSPNQFLGDVIELPHFVNDG